jgi:2-hydroxy-6-oxonona-2,4-dienedioate hydrolase
MSYEIKLDGKFKFIEEGEGEPLLLLHGLFGALSNFQFLIEHFRKSNKVIVPLLPLLELDLLHTSVGGLQKFVHRFIEHRNYNNINLLGNSLGGHVALVHILKNPERIKSIILTLNVVIKIISVKRQNSLFMIRLWPPKILLMRFLKLPITG